MKFKNNAIITHKKKIILFFLILILIFIIIKISDLFLKKKYGLGNVVLYQNSIINGYDLKANQSITNRRGNSIIINNIMRFESIGRCKSKFFNKPILGTW